MQIRPTVFIPPAAAPADAKPGAKRQAAQSGMKQQDLKQQAVRQQKDAVTGARDPGAEEDLSPAAQLQNFIDASDNIAVAMGRAFKSGLDKKTEQNGDHFERVLDDEASPKAQQIVKVAKAPDISVEELLRQARGLFPDISDLVMVLRELLRRRQLDALVRARLQKALQQAESEAPPRALKAGINVALKARLFGAKLTLNASLLRASYRQFLESQDPAVTVYEEWIASYGHERRALVMEFLESAVVADMMSQDPSCSRIEFGYLLGKLSQLKLLRSAEQLFIDTLLKEPLIGAHNGCVADWLVFMLAVLRSPQELDALLMDVLGRQILLSTHAQRSTLLQTLRLACLALPHQLFVEQEAAAALPQGFDRLAGVAYRREVIARRRRGAAAAGADEQEDEQEGGQEDARDDAAGQTADDAAGRRVTGPGAR